MRARAFLSHGHERITSSPKMRPRPYLPKMAGHDASGEPSHRSGSERARARARVRVHAAAEERDAAGDDVQLAGRRHLARREDERAQVERELRAKGNEVR